MPQHETEMSPAEFREAGRAVVNWIASYLEQGENLPVLAQVDPGGLVDRLPPSAPDQGRPMEDILADFESEILPHVTHWNHPGFMAYFAAGGSAPGTLAEALCAALNNVGLLWRASPALAELEQTTTRWLAQWLDLPQDWFGMIHSTASEASLHAVIAAREAAREKATKAGGRFRLDRLVIYASEHAHMSIEKAMLALGHGRDACRKIAVDDEFRMSPDVLERAIERDLTDGLLPIAVCGTVGTTSAAAVDPVSRIADVCERHGLWLHVDAAYAGPCAMLPEHRRHFSGCERADSFLLNPHKWMFCPMDLTAFYTRRPEAFRRALSLTPEYLTARQDPRAVNFMEYSIPLGRRFRALKLWMVMSYFGRDGIAALLRGHIRMARWLAGEIERHPEFELAAPALFSLVCLRYRPAGGSIETADAANERLLDAVNQSGEFFLSHTKLDGRFTIRAAIGNIRTTQAHVERLWEVLQQQAGS